MPYIPTIRALIHNTVPYNGASDVPCDTTIQILFTEDMDVATLNQATCILLDNDFNKVATTVTYQQRTVVITPSAPLTPQTRYQLVLKGGQDGITSITGLRLATDYNINFTTVESEALPSTELLEPADGSVLNGTISFSWEQVDGISSYDIQISMDPNFGSTIISARVDGTIYSPNVMYVNNITYYWRVRPVSDIAGPWTAVRQFRYYLYTPISSYTPLVVTSASPSPDSTGAPLGTDITIRFSDILDPGSIDNAVISVRETNLVEIGEPIQVSGSISVSDRRIVFIPDNDLKANCLYTVVVSRDIYSQAGVSLDDDYSWTFSTSLSPYYTTTYLVRKEIGDFISRLPDLDLSLIIREVSLWADHIAANPYGTQNTTAVSETQQQTTNEIYYHNYTLYETALRALARVTLEHVQSHNESKQIGDFTVRAAGSMTPDINVVIKRLEALRNEAKMYLTMGTTTFALPVTAVKGEAAYPYPLNQRRF